MAANYNCMYLITIVPMNMPLLLRLNIPLYERAVQAAAWMKSADMFMISLHSVMIMILSFGGHFAQLRSYNYSVQNAKFCGAYWIPGRFLYCIFGARTSILADFDRQNHPFNPPPPNKEDFLLEARPVETTTLPKQKEVV
jgi:hypothetical protein